MILLSISKNVLNGVIELLNDNETRYCVEYTVLINVVNKVMIYEKEIITEKELSTVGNKAIKLNKKYPNSYVMIKIT